MVCLSLSITKILLMWKRFRDQDLHLKVLSQETKENRALKVSCYAKEPKGDELIGAGEVDIKETLKTGEFDGVSAHNLDCPHPLMR